MQFIALGKATQLTLGTGDVMVLDSVKGCTPPNGLWNGEPVC